MTGGVATALVAANPVTAGRGGSLPHTLAAAAAFIALAAYCGRTAILPHR